MKILGKVILGLLGLSLAAVAAVFLINAFDESPSPLLEAAASQNRWARAYEEGNGYFYLLGFASPADSDPARAAQGVVERYNFRVDADHRELSLSDLMQDIRGLVLNGDEAMLCDWQKAACLAHFEQHAASFDELVSDNPLLLERYDALIRHPDYRPAIKPSSLEPYVARYSLPQYAQQLMFYRVFTNSDGNPDAEAIERDLGFWRRVLANTDIVADKALAVRLVKNNAAFRHALDARNGTRHTSSLSALNDAEAGLEPVLRRELHTGLRTVDQLDRFGFTETSLGGGWIDSPLGRYFFKPTATKNLIASYFDRLIGILGDDPGTWRPSLESLELDFEGKTSGISMLYNPVGKSNFLGNAGSLADFRARLINLAGYLALVRLTGQLAAEMTDDEIDAYLRHAPAELRNPWDGTPMRYDAESQTIYFVPLTGREKEVSMPVPSGRSGTENDLAKCKRLSFDPLRGNVPFCSRLIDDPALSRDVRLEALAARARAYVEAITYRAGHDVTERELRAAALADWDDAVVLVRKSGDRDRLPALLRERGGARWMTADYEGALADYNAYLIEMEEVSAVLGSRAMMFEQLGRYNEAIQDMTAAIRLVGSEYCSNLHNWVLQRGEMYEAAGDLAAAERDYRITLGADPEHRTARAALERIGVDPDEVGGIDDLPVPPTCSQ